MDHWNNKLLFYSLSMIEHCFKRREEGKYCNPHKEKILSIHIQSSLDENHLHMVNSNSNF